MRVRFSYVAPAAIGALLSFACGETKQQPPAAAGAGAGGVLAAGTNGEAGAESDAQAGHTTETGAGGATGAGQAGQAAQAGRGGAPACVPEAHERPVPGPLSGSVASLSGDFIGLYKIDDVFEQASDCTSMCRIGSSVSP